MSKEEKCYMLHDLYGWDLKKLLKNTESQIDTLFNACKDEDGGFIMAKHMASKNKKETFAQVSIVKD